MVGGRRQHIGICIGEAAQLDPQVTGPGRLAPGRQERDSRFAGSFLAGRRHPGNRTFDIRQATGRGRAAAASPAMSCVAPGLQDHEPGGKQNPPPVVGQEVHHHQPLRSSAASPVCLNLGRRTMSFAARCLKNRSRMQPASGPWTSTDERSRGPRASGGSDQSREVSQCWAGVTVLIGRLSEQA